MSCDINTPYTGAEGMLPLKIYLLPFVLLQHIQNGTNYTLSCSYITQSNLRSISDNCSYQSKNIIIVLAKRIFEVNKCQIFPSGSSSSEISKYFSGKSTLFVKAILLRICFTSSCLPLLIIFGNNPVKQRTKDNVCNVDVIKIYRS